MPIEAFIEKDTFFLKPVNYTTITGPGNVSISITITAYNHIDQRLYDYTSLGYTVLDEVKPDLAAPGVNLYCPTVGNQFVRSSGSSLAAAYTTGVVALLFEWGIIEENLITMDGVIIKRMLVDSAQRDPQIRYPNQEVGYGILGISSTLNLDMWRLTKN